jgi:1-acyl-sn-glycerol-3-phosphate acyltransferase
VRPQVYIDPRPAEVFEKYHRRVRERGPDFIYPLARMVLTPLVLSLYRPSGLGVENVPERGPSILAPNHFSNFDHFFLGLFIRRRVQFMAKSQLFRFPLDFILSHGGTFPVMRGQHDEEAFITAHSVLRQGGVVGMYAEGGRSRSKKLGQPRAGLGRLALESGAPVVPVAIHGSEHVRELRFPRVTIQYGEPVMFDRVSSPDRDQCKEASRVVFDRVREMYETLRAYGRRGARRALREGRTLLPPRRPVEPAHDGADAQSGAAREESRPAAVGAEPPQAA